MKFCNQCGNQLNGEKFCTKCGAKVEPDFVQPKTLNMSAASVVTQKKYKWIVAAVAVLAVIVIAVLLFKGRSYKKTVSSFMDATVFDPNAEKVISLLPDKLVDYIIEDDYDGDRDKMIADFEDEYGSMLETLENMEVDLSEASYKITETDDATESEVEEINNDFRDKGIDVEIKESKTVEVELKYTVKGKEQTRTTDIDLGKIGLSWYIITM